MNPTPAEIKVAAHAVAEARKALEEARTHADCTELAALLEERLAPCQELIENASRRAEMLDEAHRARTAAVAALHAAQSVPLCADRVAALQRRDEIDFRSALVLLRDEALALATARQFSPFAGIDRLIDDSARRAAEAAVQAIVTHVLSSATTPPGIGSHRADPEQSALENLEAHRAIARIEARDHAALRFSDKAGVSRAVAAVRSAFDSRIANRVSREEARARQDAKQTSERARVQAYAADTSAGKVGLTAESRNGWRSL